MQITENRVLDYNSGTICGFGVSYPFNSDQFLSFVWFKHRSMHPTERERPK